MRDDLILGGIVLAYVAFIFIKGLRAARKVGDLDDFLVAGRRIGWFPLACTMGATVIGGGSSVGAFGKTYEWGLLMLLVSSGWYIHFIFSGLVVAPKFRDAELYTVAGYFGHRFGEGPRRLATLLSLIFSVFVIAAQMAAFGSVVTALAPGQLVSPALLTGAILVGGTLVIIYSTAGGLVAVIQTDLYQFGILLVGFAITLLWCLPDLMASWDTLDQTVPAFFFQPQGEKGWSFTVTTFAAFLLGETFAPGYATRYCVGRSIRETRIGIAGVGLFLALTFPALLFFISLYARLHFPDIDPQQALPMVVRQLNNPYIGGVMLGALLMAVMSSADSALNSATTIFVKDLFEHLLGWQTRGEAEESATAGKQDPPHHLALRRARVCSVALGLSGVAVAAAWPDVIGLLLFTYHLWAPAVILPVCVGALSKERSPALSKDILCTMLLSIAATLAFRATDLSERFDPSVVGVAVSCLGFAVLRTGRRIRSAVG